MARETLDDIEKDIRKNYATCYWSEDAVTSRGDIPVEKTVDPAKLLKRFKKARRYVWMVTTDGSSQGIYENAASSCLFATEAEATHFIKEQLSDIVADNVLGGVVLNLHVLDAAIEKHCKWFGRYEAQFRDGDSVTDFRIELVPVPEPKKERKPK